MEKKIGLLGKKNMDFIPKKGPMTSFIPGKGGTKAGKTIQKKIKTCICWKY